MTVERLIRIFAGFFVLASLGVGVDLFEGGQEAGRASGAMDKGSLVRWIAQHT